MKSAKSRYILVALAFFLLAVGTVYFFVNKSHTPNISTAKTSNHTISKTEAFLTGDELENVNGIKLVNTSSTEAEKYKNEIRQFETYQVNHNVSGVLNMFSPPASADEKGTLSWLNGSDAQLEIPRLYGINLLRYKLNWYSFDLIEKEPNGNFLINVLECNIISPRNWTGQ